MTLKDLLKKINTDKADVEILLYTRKITYCVARDDNPALCRKSEICSECPIFKATKDTDILTEYEDSLLDGKLFIMLNNLDDFMAMSDYLDWHVSEIHHYDMGLKIYIEEKNDWGEENG